MTTLLRAFDWALSVWLKSNNVFYQLKGKNRAEKEV